MLAPGLNQAFPADAADSRWKNLYRIGGITSLMAAILVIMAVIAFFIWPYKPGYTSTANIFTLLQRDRLGGLISLDLLMLVIVPMTILPSLALYVALKPVNESYALIALVLWLTAVGLIVPARPLAELVTLSEKYAAATTEGARSQYLAAGEALLALFSGTAWMLYNILSLVSGLISSCLMLRSKPFTKLTAYLGVINSIAGFGFLIPVVGPVLLFVSTVGTPIWYTLVARTFFRLGWGKSAASKAASPSTAVSVENPAR
jgi:hypothetical protein